MKKNCRLCSPKNFCDHGRTRTLYKECKGESCRRYNRHKITGIKKKIIHIKLEETGAADSSAPLSATPLPPTVTRQNRKRKIDGIKKTISHVKSEN